MVQKRKWLEGVRPDDAVSDAARQALEQRLELVWHYLTRASDRKPEAEDVHQLRVSTRRAAAVIEAYEDVLPPRHMAWFQKKLRKIRKAANDARDFDVMRHRLEEQSEADGNGGWKSLLKRIKRLRESAQAPIDQISDKLRTQDFVRRIERFVDRVGWRDESRPEPSFADVARERLQLLAEPFFLAAKDELLEIEALHAFRIHGKQLRYAIEIFVAAVASPLRTEIYPLIEQLQERLGRINDHASAIARYQAWAVEWNNPELGAALESLIDAERQALEECRQEFHAWWTPDQAVDLEQRMREILSGAVTEHVA